jgi:phosphatidylinositol alpha-mannosyltransferase
MKIGLVLDDTLDTPDGVQQYVLSVGAWLQENGHEVHYLVGHTTRTDLKHVHSLSRNLRVKFNGNRMSMPLPTSLARLRTFLAEQQFDVLHVQVPYSPFLAGRLLRAVPSETAVIGTFHILPYSRLVTVANRGLGMLNKRSGRRFDRMIAVSEPAATFARRHYGYQCEVIPNPVRLAQFSNATPASSDTTILFLGRLVARKGSLLLLQAIQQVRTQHLYDKPFRVVLGGKGELRPTLERYVSQHGLSDIVSFQGFVAEEAKADFLAQGDIVAYPSVAGESFGIVLLEGMAAARGVVLGGNNPGYSSVLGVFPNQLFDPRDTAAFAHKLAQYLGDPAARLQAAAEQRQYVKRFDISVVGSQLLEVYTDALQSRTKS